MRQQSKIYLILLLFMVAATFGNICRAETSAIQPTDYNQAENWAYRETDALDKAVDVFLSVLRFFEVTKLTAIWI